ncbi:hypothetical protein [Flavobacterium gelatinilyticum]|uniref:hypothetical protein n=1 Tax=Flavobacterium gelatinilyticum TaxID=3003260 RepID=UPI00247FD734|nr:hypothetical protein [Flavobacterium gelatinilyticum]
MKLKKSVRIESEKHSVLKNRFSVDLEKYLRKKLYFLKKKSISSDYILLILSSENNHFKGQLSKSEYELLFEVLQNHTFIKNKNAAYPEYFIVMDKKNFQENESILSSLFGLFQFLMIAELKKQLTKEELIKEINKFTLLDILSFKRWSAFSNDMLFFDSNHEAGHITCMPIL